jgi:hypothetical protein
MNKKHICVFTVRHLKVGHVVIGQTKSKLMGDPPFRLKNEVKNDLFTRLSSLWSWGFSGKNIRVNSYCFFLFKKGTPHHLAEKKETPHPFIRCGPCLTPPPPLFQPMHVVVFPRITCVDQERRRGTAFESWAAHILRRDGAFEVPWAAVDAWTPGRQVPKIYPWKASKKALEDNRVQTTEWRKTAKAQRVWGGPHLNRVKQMNVLRKLQKTEDRWRWRSPQRVRRRKV